MFYLFINGQTLERSDRSTNVLFENHAVPPAVVAVLKLPQFQKDRFQSHCPNCILHSKGATIQIKIEIIILWKDEK